MAKAVRLARGKEFVFTQTKSGGEAKYPWDTWFGPADEVGPLLMLERSLGEDNDKGTIEQPTEKRDYEVSTNAMVPKLVTAGRRRYKVIQISRLDADGKRLKDALIIRARPMTDEEKVAEDNLRVEEKIKHKARLAKAKAESNGHDVPDDDEVSDEAE